MPQNRFAREVVRAVILLIGALPTRGLGAEWGRLEVVVPPKPYLSHIYFYDALSGWMVGGKGTIRATTDGGAHWVSEDGNIDGALSDVVFANKALGWAVGEHGAIISTKDGGEHWASQVSNSDSSLSSIQFVDNKIGWAIGNKGTILYTSDAGHTWIKQESPLAVNFNSLYFLNSSVGWIVGDGGSILYTDNAGKTWLQQPNAIKTTLRDVSFIDPKHGWAVGASGTIRVTVDGGIHWTEQDSHQDGDLIQVKFLDPRNGLAVGSSGLIIATNDGGVNWFTSKVFVGHRLTGMSVVDNQTFWALLDQSISYLSADGGKTWLERGIHESLGLSAVTFSDERHGWIAGDGGVILVTQDGGKNWLYQDGKTDKLFSGIYFLNTQVGWAVGKAGTIRATEDGGIHWREVESGTEKDLNSVFFSEANTGWVAGASGTIRKTADGGLHWEEEHSHITKDLHAVMFAKGGSDGWAVGDGGTIVATINGGEDWYSQPNPGKENLLGVSVVDAGHVWVCGASGEMLVTDNAGQKWERQKSDVEDSYGYFNDILGVSFINTDDGWAVGEDGIFISTRNGGRDWMNASSDDDADLNAIAFSNRDTGWAVGARGTIKKFHRSAHPMVGNDVKVTTSVNGDVDVSFSVLSEHPISSINVDASVENGTAIPIGSPVSEPLADQRWHFRWRPSFEKGTKVTYRAIVDDKGPLLPPIFLGKFEYGRPSLGSLIEENWKYGVYAASLLWVVSFLTLLALSHRRSRALAILSEAPWAKLATWPFIALRHVPSVQMWVLEPWFREVRKRVVANKDFLDPPVTESAGRAAMGSTLLKNLRSEHRVWLQGSGGMGKSSVFDAWEREYFCGGDRPNLRKAVKRWGYILVPVRIRRYADLPVPEPGRPESWIVEVVRQHLEQFGLDAVDTPLTKAILKAGRVAVALDGLNEADCRPAVEAFSRQFSQVPMLATSQSAGPDGWSTWRLPDNIAALQEGLLNLWIGQEKAAILLQRIREERLADVIVSGYDLRLLADLAKPDPKTVRLPNTRIALYREILERASTPEDAPRRIDGLKRVAWTMIVAERRNIGIEDENLLPVGTLDDMVNEGTRIVRRSGKVREFRHDQMRAFLASLWLVDEMPTLHALEMTLIDAKVFRINRRDQVELWRFFSYLLSDSRLAEVWQFAITDPEERSLLVAAVQVEADTRGLILQRGAARS